MQRFFALGTAAVMALFFLVQLVPYRVHNPPVTGEATWSSAEVETLARTACFDCHSNESKTPWYGHIAPVAWYVNHHVLEAREALNFSTLDQPQQEAHEAGEEVMEGKMPPDYYLRMHPEARLTPAERKTLADGLDLTLRDVKRGGHHDQEDHD